MKMMQKQELIDKYLHGELNPEETNELERLSSEDENFANELEIQSVYYAERSANLKAELIGRKNNLPQKSKSKLPPLVLLAIVIAVTAFLIKTYLIDNKSDTKIYAADTYLTEKHVPPSILMGTQTEDELWAKSITLYNESKYEESAKSFIESSTIKGKTDQAMLYAALSHVYSKSSNYENAIPILTQLISKNSLYIEEAKWYLALIYVKIKNDTQSEYLLKEIINDKSWNHLKAEKVLNSRN